MNIQILKYTLEDFNNITYNGFKFDFPENVLKIISDLASEVGSPNYVKTPIFEKRDNPLKGGEILKEQNTVLNLLKKKKNNRSKEIINDNDWDALRTFQPTKIEEKVGIENQIDLIRSYLNKLTDKNYIDIRNKIIDLIDNIFLEQIDNEKLMKLGNTIFEIASTNRFYSKMYADLYSDLIHKYQIMREIFNINFNNFNKLFDNIQYVDPNIDYDLFCKINKDNEKRKALATFFVNLMINKIISEKSIIDITTNLFHQIYNFINIDNKKNEVDELTENISILYKRDLFEQNCHDLIDGMTIIQLVEKLAHSKSKSYLSLTNKSIFKFMDLIEM
jgi:hypothetical protein